MNYAWSVPSADPVVPSLSDYKIIVKELDMNKDGKLTDVHGNLLAVGQQVKIAGDFKCCADQHGTGTVMVLHESGDYQGFVSVRWRDHGRGCSVPDKALRIVARKAAVVPPIEMQAFALFLRNEWALEALVSDEDVASVVARYIVARMEVDKS